MRHVRIGTLLIAAAGVLLALLPCRALAQKPPATSSQNSGQSTEAQSQAGAPAKQAAPHPTLADFAWLEGRWRGEWGPRVAEQNWFAPKAGLMAGLFRLVENDKTLVLEFFTLVETPEGITFYFRHFTPELVPWEKNAATVLQLGNVDAKRIEFENPADGQPKRAILIRIDPDTYTSRAEIVPEQGDPQVIEITYHRQKPQPEKSNAGNGARR